MATKELLDMDGARVLLQKVKGSGGGTGGGSGEGLDMLGLYKDADGDICQKD